MLIRFYYWAYIILLSLRWMPQINLGDWVWYKGRKYQVMNGVRCESWRLNNFNNGDDGWVKRAETKKVISISNFVGSFRSGYRFYMGYWFNIWVNNGIEPWVRGLSIWPRKQQPPTAQSEDE